MIRSALGGRTVAVHAVGALLCQPLFQGRRRPPRPAVGELDGRAYHRPAFGEFNARAYYWVVQDLSTGRGMTGGSSADRQNRRGCLRCSEG